MKLTVPTLEKLAGAIWFSVGGMLVVRGVLMLIRAAGPPEESSLWTLGFSALVGLAIGAAKGRFVLSRTAAKNRARIGAQGPAPIWSVFSPRTWLLVASMIGLGILLRRGAANGWLGGFTVVGGLYVGIGAALIASSLAYFAPPHVPLPTVRTSAPPSGGRRKVGVMVVNLGTPDAPTPEAVKRYLRQFLSDRRVVEVNPLLWSFVLNVIILPRRCKASAEAYREVWTDEGSPLLSWTDRITHGIAEHLGDDFSVKTAMRYGSPSMGKTMCDLQGEGCEPIVVLPLFPQFSNSTTGSVQAEAFRLAEIQRNQPTLQFVAPYYEASGYIDALAERIEEARAKSPVDFHVFSFHGVPEKYIEKGDPYLEHCTRTAWALAERLKLAREEWEMVFQSRFGPDPWLQPYADQYVPALAHEHKRVLITMPGFAADCLETIEEIGLRLREDFEAAGGEELVVVPALNDQGTWVGALAELVRTSALPTDASGGGETHQVPLTAG